MPTDMKIENDHNVYILGAGFSHEAGMPLVRDFLNRMRDCLPTLLTTKRQRESDAIEKVLNFRLNAASAAYWVSMDLEDIEELFSLASALAGGLSSHMRLAMAATLDFCGLNAKRKQISVQTRDPITTARPPWQIPASDRESRIDDYVFHLAALLGLFPSGEIRGKNSFITFNYDTVAENALSSLGVPFDYGFKKFGANYDATAKCVSDDNAVKFLKLHGSVNWAWPQKRGHKLTVYGGYGDVLAQEKIPELTPPTWKKVFALPIAHLWEQAIEALRSATRVIIVGFSMPPTDMHFKYLLASGLQQNVSIREIIFANPQQMHDKMANLLRHEYIQKGKISSLQTELGGMTRNLEFMRKIGRPLPFQNVSWVQS